MTQAMFPFRAVACWAAAVAVAVACLPQTTHAYTPQSPEVKRVVDKGIKFLESPAATDNRVGAQALVGLALLKHGDEPSHPRILQAVKVIQASIRARESDPAKVSMDIYSTGLSIIFLITLDPSKYGPEIDILLGSLKERQKDHGGWGYPDRTTGDTSMTQYGVLSCWEAAQVGRAQPVEEIEHVADWLLRTQDPTGGFGYQGSVSPNYNLVKQTNVRHSLTAAGMGSLLMCADMLGLVLKADQRDDELPPAMKEVKAPKEEEKKLKSKIDVRLVRDAHARAGHWMRANYEIDPKQWTHYYLYALERYMSFRELVDGKPEKEPKWYNDGVRYLIATQADNGSWQSNAKETADTAFAVLFLLRSMKKSIEKARDYGAGTLVGGRGLPKDTDRAEIRMGKVVARPLLGPAEQMLSVLESPDSPDYDHALDVLAELPAGEASGLIAKHADTLRKLATARSAEARQAAVRALGKTRDLDNVPTLIYALTDPDQNVVREARDALRRISRKPTGFGPPDQMNDADRRTAIAQWKEWYLSVRPDAVLD